MHKNILSGSSNAEGPTIIRVKRSETKKYQYLMDGINISAYNKKLNTTKESFVNTEIFKKWLKCFGLTSTYAQKSQSNRSYET